MRALFQSSSVKGRAAVSDPVILRIVRPFHSIDDYLDAESCTIDPRGMLLVDAEPLEEGTLVRFVVSLASGEAVIKAEGRVKSHQSATADEPGGLQVRFKRYGTGTKQFIDRAMSHRVATRRPPSLEPEIDSSPTATQVTEAEVSTPDASAAPLVPGSVTLAEATTESDEVEDSGIRARASDIEPPENRDALLDKLRERARQMTEAKIASFSQSAKVG